MFGIIQKWHRQTGILAVLFLIFLIVSGIVLNHSEQFGLNKTYIGADLLLDLYDIQPSSEPVTYKTDTLNVTQLGERLYVNNNEVDDSVQQLIGLVKLPGFYVVAYDQHLLLLTAATEVIEILGSAEGVPAGMKRVGVDEQGMIVIEAAHGYYFADLDELLWEEQDYYDATWSTRASLSPEEEETLLKLYRGKGLTMERVLLDFHSGRIVGNWGIYVVDAAAILLLFISLTGIWMWTKR